MTEDQLAEWKAALAAHHKQQRRDRWRRKPAPMTCVKLGGRNQGGHGAAGATARQ